MADIAMCQNDDCPMREKCYRYMAKSSGNGQSYALYEPDENGRCEDFLWIYRADEPKKEGER